MASPQPSADLFRALLFLEQAVDAVPCGGRNAAVDFPAAPSPGETIGLLWAIPPSPLIPSHFTANGGFVGSNHSGDLLIGMVHVQ